jgi:hypothetical protein
VTGALSAIIVLLGTTVAYFAARHARYRRPMQTVAGLLLTVGFALLGYALECVFGAP